MEMWHQWAELSKGGYYICSNICLEMVLQSKFDLNHPFDERDVIKWSTKNVVVEIDGEGSSVPPIIWVLGYKTNGPF